MPPKRAVAVVPDLIDIPTQDAWDTPPPYSQYHLDFTKNIHGIVHINITTLQEAIDASSDSRHISNLKTELAKQIKSQSQLVRVLSRINQALNPEHSPRTTRQTARKQPHITPEIRHKMSLQKKMQGIKTEVSASDDDTDSDESDIFISSTHGVPQHGNSKKRKEPQSNPAKKRTRTTSSSNADVRNFINLLDDDSDNDRAIQNNPMQQIAHAMKVQAHALAALVPKSDDPDSDLELPPLYEPALQYLPPSANGNDPDRIPQDPTLLWLHVNKSTIISIIQSKFTIEKLHTLIPIDERISVYERGDLTISKNGTITQTNTASDLVKTSKHFPTIDVFLRAFTLWAEIRTAYTSSLPYSRALFTHMRIAIQLAATAPWKNVIRYELAFLRLHQGSISSNVWSQVDTQLFLTTGLTTNNTEKAAASPVCCRWNNPVSPGQQICHKPPCRYEHICSLCHSRWHPAYSCPQATPNTRTHQRERDASHSQSYTQPHNNPNNIPLQNRISRPP